MDNDGGYRSAVSDIIPNNQQRRKQSFIRKIFTARERNGRAMAGVSVDSIEALSDSSVENQYFSSSDPPMTSGEEIQNLSVFVATWNVGGQCPNGNLDLSDFLQVRNEPDIYVLGFQEIVPLNAGNVLVLEDNEPAAKWLALINQSLNGSSELSSKGLKPTASFGGSLFFQKPTYQKLKKTLRTINGKRLKSCNCTVLEMERKASKEFCFLCQESNVNLDDSSSEEDDESYQSSLSLDTKKNMKYSLVASKQMVGIFVTVWMKQELVQYVGHLRVCCISRGIMGCLGNKGCISVSMSLFQTSFCFICSHLASGEKEGDELRRNLDVIEILKNTQFPRICKTSYSRMPDRILDHDRIIWLGDLNYRISLSYDDAKRLVERKDWPALFDKDQLQMEREAGRVFKGWKEGKIYFAPTYKYPLNSDTYYYAEGVKVSKNKRRTPAWCDRILWRGRGIQQHCYVRKELKFSDHRPVCATFLVEAEVMQQRRHKKKVSAFNFQIQDLVPSRTTAYYSSQFLGHP